MRRTQRQFLADIMEAMTNAIDFVEGMSFEDLEDDVRTQWALERAFGIIGEAAKKVDPALREAHPQVPWSQMAGMRDVLVHGYWAVKLELVWDTIHRHFPPTIAQLKLIFDALPEEPFDADSSEDDPN